MSAPCARAFIALARNSPSGCPVIASGSAITSDGRTIPLARSSAPAGKRWIAVIGAPESVVGIATTFAPEIAATAFATSITRPPPSATRGRTRTPSSACEGGASAPVNAAAAAGTCPLATS